MSERTLTTALNNTTAKVAPVGKSAQRRDSLPIVFMDDEPLTPSEETRARHERMAKSLLFASFFLCGLVLGLVVLHRLTH